MLWNEDVCPSSSLDLNLMSCCVCGVAKTKVNEHPLMGHAALQEKIRQWVHQIEGDEAARGRERFHPRLERLIQVGGDLIE